MFAAGNAIVDGDFHAAELALHTLDRNAGAALIAGTLTVVQMAELMADSSTIEGAELSSVRKVDGAVEVRIWNPSQEPREAWVAGRFVRLGPARIETIRLD